MVAHHLWQISKSKADRYCEKDALTSHHHVHCGRGKGPVYSVTASLVKEYNEGRVICQDSSLLEARHRIRLPCLILIQDCLRHSYVLLRYFTALWFPIHFRLAWKLAFRSATFVMRTTSRQNEKPSLQLLQKDCGLPL